MKIFARAILISAILLALAGLASAESKPYLGLGLGQSKIEVDCPECDRVDEEDTSFKVFGGLEVNPNFALEFGYASLGEFSGHLSYYDGLVDYEETDTYEASSLFAVAAVKLPLNETISLFGKAGVAYWTLDVSDKGHLYVWDGSSWIGGPATASGDGSGTSPLFGLGVEIKATEQLSVRLEWERYKDVGDGVKFDVYVAGSYIGSGEVEGYDVDVAGVALMYKF